MNSNFLGQAFIISLFILSYPYLSNFFLKKSETFGIGIETINTPNVSTLLDNCSSRPTDSTALLDFFKELNEEAKIILDWNPSNPMEMWKGVNLSIEGCVVELDLSNSQIGPEVPIEITELKALRILNLSNNKLENCAIGSGQSFWCEQLSEVNISGNSSSFFKDIAEYCNPSWDLTCKLPNGTMYAEDLDDFMEEEELFSYRKEVLPNYHSFECIGSIKVFNEIIRNDCEADQLIRTYELYDDSGELRDTCIQRLRFIKPGLNNVRGPAPTELNCTDTFTLTERELPHPDFTGYPEYYPNSLLAQSLKLPYQNISATYQDGSLDFANGKGEFIRTWSIMDTCEDRITTFKQKIRFCLPCERRDRLILDQIYGTTNGPNWTDPWDVMNPNLIDRSGVSLNAEGCVTRLELAGRNLNGILPTSIGGLSELNYLALNNNSLRGILPQELGQLFQLDSLNLANNNFTGTFPEDLALLTVLRVLNLDSNQLSGNIPARIGEFLNLETLQLAYNNFEGELPDGLGNLERLQTLHLQGNRFINISNAINNLNSLGSFRIDRNAFTFEDLFKVEDLINNSEIVRYDLQDTFYVDTIFRLGPGEDLAINLLVDSTINSNKYLISNENFDFSSDDHIILIENVKSEYTGDYIAEISNPVFPLLTLSSRNIRIEVDVENCTHPDFIPLVQFYRNTGGANAWDNSDGWEDGHSGRDCNPCNNWYGVRCENNRVVSLDLDGRNDSIFGPNGPDGGNGLIMNFGDALSQLTELRNISLHGNKLTGELPASLANLGKLEYLGLADNDFNGSIPSTWSDFERLQVLDLTNNSLIRGSFPEQITQVETLRELRFSNCGMEGSVPKAIANLKQLQSLWLNKNNFTGSFPDVSELTLQALRLDDNCFDFIPDLSLINTWRSDNLGGYQVQNNKLTFTPIVENTINGNWVYSPQDSIIIDTIICLLEGDSLIIDLGIDPNLESNVYTWFKNGTAIMSTRSTRSLLDPFVELADSGFYRVEVTNVEVDSLVLYSRPIKVKVERNCSLVQADLGKDTTACIGSRITLVPKIGICRFCTYEWSDGSEESSLEVTVEEREREYSVTITNSSGCSDSTKVKVIPGRPFDFNLSFDNNICSQGTGTAMVSSIEGVAPISYQWSDNLGTKAEVQNLNSGDYSVTITDATGCSVSESFMISYETSLRENIDSIVCAGTEVLFRDSLIRDTGLYQFIVKGEGACDTLLEFRLDYSGPDSLSRKETICMGDTLVIGDTSIVDTGKHIFSIETAEGCLQWIDLDLKFFPLSSRELDTIICFGDSLEIGNEIIKKVGKDTILIEYADECSELVYLDLAYYELELENIDTVLCTGDTLKVGDTSIVAPAELTYIVPYKRAPFCDSIIYNIILQASGSMLGDSRIISADDSTCIAQDTLEALLPVGAIGIWTKLSEEIVLGDSPILIIDRLDPGENLFEWMVMGSCGEPSRDTVRVFYNEQPLPKAIDFDYTLSKTETAFTANLNENGVFNYLPNRVIDTIEVGEGLTFKSWQNGNFELENISLAFELGMFSYTLLSSENCPELLDKGIVRIIRRDEDLVPDYYGMTIGPDSRSNNEFNIPNYEQFEKIEVKIFSRTDGIIFQSDQYDNKWDGRPDKFSSIYFPSGEYLYWVKLKKKDIPKPFEEIGKIILLTRK